VYVDARCASNPLPPFPSRTPTQWNMFINFSLARCECETPSRQRGKSVLGAWLSTMQWLFEYDVRRVFFFCTFDFCSK
jgi:hypothetical protein